VIDEYAKIDLILFWLSPISPPKSELIDAKIINVFGMHDDWMDNDIMLSGPSFCQVDKMRQLVHEIDDITDGNQKWHGAIPSFKIKAVIKI
jgi:hypothetical protein